MCSPFSLTIDWLSFTLPSGTVKNTMEVLEGEWMKDKGGFRGIITRKVCGVEWKSWTDARSLTQI